MHTLNPIKAGVAFGVVLGLWHLCWAALVAFGPAQALIDFILRLHFIEPFIKVQPFVLGTAAMLVGVTALVGFAFGVVFAITWNALHPAEA
jgi:hypothetical protein